jgi:hypothetical protein
MALADFGDFTPLIIRHYCLDRPLLMDKITIADVLSVLGEFGLVFRPLLKLASFFGLKLLELFRQS